MVVAPQTLHGKSRYYRGLKYSIPSCHLRVTFQGEELMPPVSALIEELRR